MSVIAKYRYCFTAGACAAGGSFFGKLPSLLERLMNPSTLLPEDGTSSFLNRAIIHVVPLLLMIACNVLNWRYYLKALQLAEQTLTATVLTASFNYIISFILGFMVYQERISLLATVGAGFIVAGIWFLCSAEEKRETGTKDKSS